jgi:hypothetical protein
MGPVAGGAPSPYTTATGAPTNPTASGASPYMASLAQLIGGAIGPGGPQAANMPLAQQAGLMSGQAAPSFGGGGLAPGDALAALIAGTNF